MKALIVAAMLTWTCRGGVLAAGRCPFLLETPRRVMWLTNRTPKGDYLLAGGLTLRLHSPRRYPRDFMLCWSDTTSYAPSAQP